MIDVKQSPENVVAIALQGEVSSQDIAAAKKAFDDKLANNDRIGVIIDFSGFSDATEDAIRQDIKFEMGLLGQVDRLAKVAIVSDKKWVVFFMEQAARLLPNVELDTFGPSEAGKAMSWVSDIPAEKASANAFKRIPASPESVYAFEINGTLSSEEMPAMIEDIDGFLDAHEKVRMLAKVGKLGFDPAIFMQKGLFTMKMAALDKVERYAIVGGPSWLKGAVDMMGPIVPGIEMKTFAQADESQAWEWIEATAV